MQSIADIAARFMVLAGSYRGIIKDLVCDLPTQQDKLQEFCKLERSLSIPISCFFEKYRTDYGRKFRLPGLFKGMVCTHKFNFFLTDRFLTILQRL